jgi:SWI/SNF-related matrix-associated actin-dependent regulator 1 of chromatin subfamily A
MLQEPNLFPYQLKGAEFLAARQYAGLFDGMRMGKTRQFLKAARLIGAETIAVVAKASGVYVWEKEAREWGYDPIILKAGDVPQWKKFNIFSYNGLISELHDQLVSMCYDLLGGDEADAFKSLDALRTQKFYGLREDKYNKSKIVFDEDLGLCAYADVVWVMTGTPMLNNPSELYPMMRTLFKDTIINDKTGEPMSFNTFCGLYCKFGKSNGFGRKIVGGKNLQKLRDLLRGRILRRTKEEVWEDWQKPIIDLLPVPGNVDGIPSDQIEMVREALQSEDIVAALRAVAPHCASLRRLTGLAKVNGVVDWIDDNIENCGKIIVFAHHKEVISTLKVKLKKYKLVEIIGGMSQEEKYDAYNAFQTDDSIQIFIGQNQAARDSIPLWKASTTISIEPDWVPGNNDQMLDRMTHFSKKEPCVGYYATLRGSIDEDIQKANIVKRETATELGLN